MLSGSGGEASSARARSASALPRSSKIAAASARHARASLVLVAAAKVSPSCSRQAASPSRRPSSRQIRSAPANTQEARQAATEFGYPVVFKPRARPARFGVSLVRDASAIHAAYQTAASNGLPEPWAFRTGVLVEEYPDGRETNVDSVCLNDDVRPMAPSRGCIGWVGSSNPAPSCGRPLAGTTLCERGFGIVTADGVEECLDRMETVSSEVRFETPSGWLVPGYAAR